MLVAHDQDDLGSGDLGRELHAAEDVLVDEVAGDPGDEDVADPAVEHVFDRHAAIDARQDDRLGELGGGGLANLGGVVAGSQVVVDEPLVAGLEQIDDRVGR